MALAAAAAGGHTAAAISGPFTLTVSAGGLSTRAILTSYCPHGAPGPPCTGSEIDPTPRTPLPVRPRQTLLLTLPAHDPTARRVIVALGRPGRNRTTQAVTTWTKRATASGTNGRRWRIRLPRNLQDATFITARIAYTGAQPPAVNGSAQFVTGMHLACAPD